LREEFPDLPVVGDILGMIYHSLGDQTHARQALQMALEGIEEEPEQPLIEQWLMDIGVE
jgi:hypothetical protein